MMIFPGKLLVHQRVRDDGCFMNVYRPFTNRSDLRDVFFGLFEGFFIFPLILLQGFNENPQQYQNNIEDIKITWI